MNQDAVAETLVDSFRHVMTNRGLSLNAIAKILGNTRSNLSRDMNRGQLGKARIERLVRLADAMGVSFVAVFAEKGREREVIEAAKKTFQ